MLFGFYEEEVRLGLQSVGRVLVHYAQNPGFRFSSMPTLGMLVNASNPSTWEMKRQEDHKFKVVFSEILSWSTTWNIRDYISKKMCKEKNLDTYYIQHG